MPIWFLLSIFFLAVLFAVKLLYLLTTGWALRVTRGALFIPTPYMRIKTFLDAIPMSSQNLIVDLGCGDGRVLKAARKRYGVKTLGFEINPFAYITAKLRNLGDKGIKIKWRDFWKEDISDATVVFCYLFPDVMKRIAQKLEAELNPGTWVVSCNFPIPGWHAKKVLHPDSHIHGDPIFIYQLPNSCPLSERPINL